MLSHLEFFTSFETVMPALLSSSQMSFIHCSGKLVMIKLKFKGYYVGEKILQILYQIALNLSLVPKL